jgi:hypothetical protein
MEPVGGREAESGSLVVTGAAHDVAPHQRPAVAAIIETPCGLTILHIGIRLLTGTPGDLAPCGPPLAGACGPPGPPHP